MVMSSDIRIYKHFIPVLQIQNPADSASRKDSAAKARNFLALLTSQSAMYFLHFLWDVTTCLASVSLIFQDRSTTVGDIHTELDAAKAILESYKDR